MVFRRIVMVSLLGLLMLGAQVEGGSWRESNIRGLLFSADRGTVTDSVMQLSDATYYPVADTSGAVFYVKAGGTVTNVVTRRKWMTSSNAQIRAYPSWIADTTGQGIDATYLGGTRYQWYLQNANDWLYTFYEIKSGADSLIAELTSVVVIGETAPDSFVTTSGIENQAISAIKLDSTDTYTFPIIRTNRIILKDQDTTRIYIKGYGGAAGATVIDSLFVIGHTRLGDAIDDTTTVNGELTVVQAIAVQTNGVRCDFYDTNDADLMEFFDAPADSALFWIPVRVRGNITTSQGGKFVLKRGSTSQTIATAGGTYDLTLPTTYTDAQYLKVAVSGAAVTVSTADPLATRISGTVTLPANKKQIGAYVSGLESTAAVNANWYTATPSAAWPNVYVFISAAEDSIEFRTTSADLAARTIMYEGIKQ